MTATFKTAPIPTIETGRAKEVNPYTVHAKAAVEARGKKNDKGEYPDAMSILFDLEVKERQTVEQAEKYMTRKIREAGSELGVTIRTKVTDGVVTAWAIDKIVREKKDAPTS